jgi:Abortive infection alpha
MGDFEEGAKAAQEIAKTTGKAIDAGRDLGGFFSRIFGRSLEQLTGIGEDSLTYHRRVRQLRLAKRFEEFRKELGYDGPIDPIDLKVGLPLIEAASIEDDDSLQDLYARLPATATNPDSRVKARRAFVSILQDVGPLEVLLLDRIYSAPSAVGAVVRTGGLPDRHAQDMDQSTSPPSPEVELALWTLARAGCIEPAGTYGGGTSIAVVTMTALGRALVEAAIRVSSADGKRDEQAPDDSEV